MMSSRKELALVIDDVGSNFESRCSCDSLLGSRYLVWEGYTVLESMVNWMPFLILQRHVVTV